MSVLELPKKWITKAKGWAVSAAFWIGGIVTLVAAMSTKAIDGNFFLAFVAIGLTGFLATLIHEIGHAWVAKRRGAKVEAIAALPFVYFPRLQKLTFEKERKSGDVGGYVTYSFPEDCGTRRDEMAIAAAGPAWNLASAGLLMLALWAGPHIGAHDNLVSTNVQVVAEQMVEPSERSTPERDVPRMMLPSEEEVDRYLSQARAQRRSEAIYGLLQSLVQVFLVVSTVSGVLSLLPYRGSDGAIILENWRWLRKLS